MKISHINETITNPVKARGFIIGFMMALGKDYETGYVETPERRINFATMTDEDALFVANDLQSWTAEAAKNRRK